MIVPTRRGVSVRLLDFGIAKVMQEDERPGSGLTLTQSARISYSPAYAAPEQTARARTGPWTDVHAIGLIMSELLTGREAYDATDPTELLAQVLAPERPTPKKYGVDVGGWEPVLAKALASRPADRYADAAELTRALASSLDDVEAVDLEALVSSLPCFKITMAHAETLPSYPELPRYASAVASGPVPAIAPSSASGSFRTVPLAALTSGPLGPPARTESAYTHEATPKPRSRLPAAALGAVAALVTATAIVVSLRAAKPTSQSSSVPPYIPPSTSSTHAIATTTQVPESSSTTNLAMSPSASTTTESSVRLPATAAPTASLNKAKPSASRYVLE
jgi:serine/threonine protein kinase